MASRFKNYVWVRNIEQGSPEDDDEAIRTLPDDELYQFIFGNYKSREWGGLSTKYLTSQCYIIRWHRRNHKLSRDIKAGVDLARRLGIRTPEMLRICQDPKDPIGFYCIYRHVPGESLADLMPRIDQQEMIRLAFQLKGILRIMHQETNEHAGSIHNLEVGRRSCLQMEDDCGLPRGSTTATDIARVVNFWFNFRWGGGSRSITREQLERVCRNGPLAENLPLVFTHYNLKPENIIRDNDGHIWIINWECAGWYPACFDRAGMDLSYGYGLKSSQWSPAVKFRWQIFSSIANDCKWSEEAFAVLRAQGPKTRCHWGRCWSVELGVTKSARPLSIPRDIGRYPL